MEGRLNLHARVLYGTNDHHKAEALFKALGRALDIATRIDKRTASELPAPSRESRDSVVSIEILKIRLS